MTTSNLLADLRRDEGFRANAYPDPLSHAEPYTIGYGHTGPEVHMGLTWSVAQAETALESDAAFAEHDLDRFAPWWRKLDGLRQDVMVNMAFNLGATKLMKFHNTLATIEGGQWQAAHDGMLASAWARQVGARAVRLANQMLTGVHQS